MGFFPTDVAAQLTPRLSIEPQAFDDGVEVSGAAIHRIGVQSAVVNVALAFETAGGAADDTVTVSVEVEDGDGTDFEEYASYEHVISVDDNDGEYTALVVLPVNLRMADEYVRVNVTVEHAGAGGFGVGSQFLSATVVGGGLVEKPEAEHEDGGYALVTAP